MSLSLMLIFVLITVTGNASNITVKKNSCIDNEWADFYNCSGFMNPPYSQTALFLEQAAQQAKRYNITVVALVNANTDTKWFADAVKSSNEIRLITGRIGFNSPSGKKANGNTKGSCLIIWRGNCKTPCNIVMVNRDELT
jgi:phage N-6-adenine-methyltransferase